MKIALCSVVSDEFVAGFICTYRSLLRHNPEWKFPVFIYCNQQNCPLSPEGRALISSHCEQAVFVEVDNQRYAGIYDYAENVIGTPRRLRAAFYILEAFRLAEFDVVISLDSDLLVMGKLDELLVDVDRFAAVRAFNPETGQVAHFVNTGVMVIGKHYLDPDIITQFTAALKTRPRILGSGKADQAIINIFFHNELIQYLPPIFNFTKRTVLSDMGQKAAQNPEAVSKFLEERGVRILHFISEKPWDPKIRDSERAFQAVEEVWFKSFYAEANPAAIHWMTARRRARESAIQLQTAKITEELVAKKHWKAPDFQKNLERALQKVFENSKEKESKPAAKETVRPGQKPKGKVAPAKGKAKPAPAKGKAQAKKR